MPSGPPVYSEVASQGRTEPNSGQGWSMPSAPPNYSDLPNGGSGVPAPTRNGFHGGNAGAALITWAVASGTLKNTKGDRCYM